VGVAVGLRERHARPVVRRTVRLSSAELSVLRELARGQRTDDIASQFFVSPHTVRSHVKNSMRKLGARNRAHAVAIALSEGAIEYSEED
jgi:DNA-binding CsgD family transcriptional regulator